MEVHHDLDIRSDRVPQRGHHPAGVIDLTQKSTVVGIGNDHDLHRPISTREDVVSAIDQLAGRFRLINSPHVSEAEMRIDPDALAHLPAEQPPHRQIKRLAIDVLERNLDSRDRADSDGAEPPEAVLLHNSDELFDVARIASDDKRSEVLDRSGDRTGLPLQGRLTPTEEAGLIGVDANENPVPHFRVDDKGSDARNLHRNFPSRQTEVANVVPASRIAALAAPR